MKINKLYLNAICFTLPVIDIFWDKPIVAIFGEKVLTIIIAIFLVLFVTANFFGKKSSIEIPKNSPLELSCIFFIIMLLFLSSIRYSKFPFCEIPPILAYLFWLSVGMVIGCFWSMKYYEKKGKE